MADQSVSTAAADLPARYQFRVQPGTDKPGYSSDSQEKCLSRALVSSLTPVYGGDRTAHGDPAYNYAFEKVKCHHSCLWNNIAMLSTPTWQPRGRRGRDTWFSYATMSSGTGHGLIGPETCVRWHSCAAFELLCLLWN